MNLPPSIPAESRPRLPRHVKLRFDEQRARWILLAPERVLLPDDTAVEVLRRCDGRSDLAGIVAGLAADYSAPEEEIARDVEELLRDLLEKGIVEL